MAAPIGNENASKSRMFHDTVRRLCVQESWKRVIAAANHMLDKAAEGERWAAEMTRDTLDGKPAQAITGAEGGPIQHEISERPKLTAEQWMAVHGIEPPK